MFQKILKSTRFVIIIAVLGSFLASVTSLAYGGFKSVVVVMDIIQSGSTEKSAKAVGVSFIEVIDLFLIGTVFYIIALGLYELFISERLDLPNWMVIKNLDDLKGILINGIVVIMTVYFLGALVEGGNQADLLNLSLSISLIIAALTVFLFLRSKKSDH
jgi:uncharacterized membrane protein YqhA